MLPKVKGESMKAMIIFSCTCSFFVFMYSIIMFTRMDDENKRLIKKLQKLEEYVDTMLIEPMAVSEEQIQAIKERIGKGEGVTK